MKNFNGSHASPSPLNSSTTVKIGSITPNSGSAKTPLSSDTTFTVKDLKQEYTKALSFIDKLKAEQNSIKNHLRMALDQKAQPGSSEHSYSPRNQSTQIIKRNVSRDATRDSDKRLMELEIENSELRSQIDTTMVRLSKVQREKQALQDKLIESESQTSSNRELASQVRSLTAEVRALKIRLQEAEEENFRLSKQKDYETVSQRPSQNLMRYVNYVSKLVSSMAPASFARTCYEERFPRSNDVCELWESGQHEAVLLKSYKYITDLLINLNSLSTEESTFRVQEAASEPVSQIPSQYGSRRNSATNPRETRDGVSKRLQPSQEGFRPHKLQFDTLETVSTSKTPGREEEGGYSGTGNEPSLSSEYEQSKRNLQRIIGGLEENKGYKKPQKKHARHSSSIIGGYRPTYESVGMEGSMVESGAGSKGYWDSRIGIGNISSTVEEYNYSVKTRRLRNDAESKGVEEEVPESCTALRVRPVKAEWPAREAEEEESDRGDRKVQKYKERESRGSKGGYRGENEDMEALAYRSEFVKTRIAGVKSDKDDRREMKREEGGEKKQMDSYGFIKKRTRENNEEDYRREYREQDFVRKEKNREVRGSVMNQSKEEEEDLEEKSKKERNYEKTQDYVEKARDKAYKGVERKVESFYRSRSMPKEDEIIEETQESEKAPDTRQADRRRRENRKKVYEEKAEEDEDSNDRNEIWDRKREELARVNKRINSSANTSMELKGKDFNTFSVSFGRTESKKKVSLSPDAKAASSIMDVPRKKRVEHNVSVNYDVITGKDRKPLGPMTVKNEERSPTVRFADEEFESKKLRKKNSSMANLKKIVSDADHTENSLVKEN